MWVTRSMDCVGLGLGFELGWGVGDSEGVGREGGTWEVMRRWSFIEGFGLGGEGRGRGDFVWGSIVMTLRLWDTRENSQTAAWIANR